MLWVVAFAALVVLVFGLRFADREVKIERKVQIQQAQLDPLGTLDRYFLDRAASATIYDGRWMALLDAMSREDQAWFEENYVMIAESLGRVKSDASDDEKRYATIGWLVDSDNRLNRPVVVRVGEDESGSRAVAYVHPPQRPDLMHEVFLAKEGGYWRIRRFMGRRDDPELKKTLIAERLRRTLPADLELEAWKANPRGFEEGQRARLLAEVGLRP
jgi:hypothetical protein